LWVIFYSEVGGVKLSLYQNFKIFCHILASDLVISSESQ
jgi:hypothetical protein